MNLSLLRAAIASSILFVLASLTAHPCGPDFPAGFVWRSTGDLILDMPEVNFYSELALHYGTAGPDAPLGEVTAREDDIVLDKDANDLAEALDAQGLPEARITELLWAYRQARDVTRRLYFTIPQNTLADGWFGRSSYPRMPQRPHRFDFAVYAPLFAALPTEFGLYAEGATLYNQGYMDEAIERWQALLALPEAERRYRSVWATEMIGKAQLILNDPEAVATFARVRELVEAGFPDPLGLRSASLGWQARMEAQSENYLSAIHLYIEQFQTGNQEERTTSHLSLDFLCNRMLRDTPPPEAIRNDPLCREVITLWVLSGRANYKGARNWTEALVESPPAEPIDAAGHLAHLYYRSGQMELAQTWVGYAAEKDLAAQWVRVKLSLRDGAVDEAESVLTNLANALEDGSIPGPKHVKLRNNLTDQLFAELGTVRLNLDNYGGAMDAFIHAGYIEDATYIADQVMTTEELATYLSTLTPEDEEKDYLSSFIPTVELLRYTLARRYAREGDFEQARPFYPEMLTAHIYREREEPVPLPALLDQYTAALKRGGDKQLNKQERGFAFFEAGQIAREWGLELLGTEHAPDWRMFDGVYTPWGKTRADAGTATAKEAVRVAENKPEPNARFHYRHLASNLMWEAAELLPDNDEKTAQALWYGGTWIENRNPSEADRFYKALVRRCRKLPIGEQADVMRWFPPKPESWSWSVNHHPTSELRVP